MNRLTCAVYTSKSSEKGLKQEFNSLDAQHEACVANHTYILSPKNQGWRCVDSSYDDGGISRETGLTIFSWTVWEVISSIKRRYETWQRDNKSRRKYSKEFKVDASWTGLAMKKRTPSRNLVQCCWWWLITLTGAFVYKIFRYSKSFQWLNLKKYFFHSLRIGFTMQFVGYRALC